MAESESVAECEVVAESESVAECEPVAASESVVASAAEAESVAECEVVAESEPVAECGPVAALEAVVESIRDSRPRRRWGLGSGRGVCVRDVAGVLEVDEGFAFETSLGFGKSMRGF